MTNEKPEYPFDTFMGGLKAVNQQLEDEYDDLETIIYGGIGFHTFFVADGNDPTRGTHTAIHQAIADVIDEVSIDATIIQHHHGEVTPETARQEAITQLREFTSLPEPLTETIGDRIEDRVRKNMDQPDT